MQSTELSALEEALVTMFHDMYGQRGFPPPRTFRVNRRENTGAGRYIDVEADGVVDVQDGYFDLGGRYISMEGVPNGLMAMAHIQRHRVHQIEIAVYGEDTWDGVERHWCIR